MISSLSPHATSTVLFFFCCCCCLTSFLSFCSSEDRLRPGKPLSINDTLISDGGVFALGFFSPSPSNSPRHCLGIWYNKISEPTVDWVGNRQNPITDPSSAVLTLSNDSDLRLTDSKGHILWSSNSTTHSTSPGNGTVEAVLLDNGNLVIRSANSLQLIWQSFDHPTDTLLPSMKFWVTQTYRRATRLVSWKYQDDPSLGQFSLGADPVYTLELFIWNGSDPYFRTSPWPGSLARQVKLSSVMFFSVGIQNASEYYMMFNVSSDGLDTTRLILDCSGKVKLMYWNNGSKKWGVRSMSPNIDCEVYGTCGPFGYCDMVERDPKCKCLHGFEPVKENDWENGDFSMGCRRIRAL